MCTDEWRRERNNKRRNPLSVGELGGHFVLERWILWVSKLQRWSCVLEDCWRLTPPDRSVGWESENLSAPLWTAAFLEFSNYQVRCRHLPVEAEGFHRAALQPRIKWEIKAARVWSRPLKLSTGSVLAGESERRAAASLVAPVQLGGTDPRRARAASTGSILPPSLPPTARGWVRRTSLLRDSEWNAEYSSIITAAQSLWGLMKELRDDSSNHHII